MKRGGVQVPTLLVLHVDDTASARHIPHVARIALAREAPDCVDAVGVGVAAVHACHALILVDADHSIAAVAAVALAGPHHAWHQHPLALPRRPPLEPELCVAHPLVHFALHRVPPRLQRCAPGLEPEPRNAPQVRNRRSVPPIEH
eukprot:2643454-Rhodomonas_salina.3